MCFNDSCVRMDVTWLGSDQPGRVMMFASPDDIINGAAAVFHY